MAKKDFGYRVFVLNIILELNDGKMRHCKTVQGRRAGDRGLRGERRHKTCISIMHHFRSVLSFTLVPKLARNPSSQPSVPKLAHEIAAKQKHRD